MRVIHDLSQFTPPPEGSVVTLGVFDGLHRGHAALLKKIQTRSGKKHARILVTYNPHPDLVLGKRKDSRGELFTYEEKLALLQKYDLDVVVFLPFTKELASMSAGDYLKKVLVDRLCATHIIIGYDQTFGKGRKGDYNFLKEKSKEFGFTVERIREVRFRGKIISSSLIRELIRQGRIFEANTLLGHDYFMTGIVVRGSQRGHKIGFPTANVDVAPTKILPAEGVYIGYAIRGNEEYRAMVNVGKNPTFDQGYLTVEAHLLDFQGNLYGERIRVFLRKRIRDEMRFNGLDELKRQLELDRKEALKVRLHEPSSPGASFLYWRRK